MKEDTFAILIFTGIIFQECKSTIAGYCKFFKWLFSYLWIIWSNVDVLYYSKKKKKLCYMAVFLLMRVIIKNQLMYIISTSNSRFHICIYKNIYVFIIRNNLPGALLIYILLESAQITTYEICTSRYRSKIFAESNFRLS